MKKTKFWVRTCAALAMIAPLVHPISLTGAEPHKFNRLEVGKKTYHRVVVLGVSETDLYFRHASGISNVKLRLLDPELRKKFNFDPKAAEEAERRQNEEDSEYFETVAVDAAEHAQKTAATEAAAAAAAAKRAASTDSSLADPLAEGSLINQPAPKLDFGRWLGDPPEMEGKAVLIFFWATWSKPCQKAIPELNATGAALRDQLVVVGWCAQPEDELSEISLAMVEFPLAADSKGALAKAAGVSSVPQVMLIDPKNIVRYIGHPAGLNVESLKKILTTFPTR